MTQEQLQDVLGMIDDDMIAQVDRLRQMRDQNAADSPIISFRRKILRRELLKWSSLAAGVCILISVGFLWRTGSPTAQDSAFFEDKYYSEQENAGSIVEDHVINPGSNTKPTSPETIVNQENSNQQESPETAPSTSWPVPPSLTLLLGSDTTAALRGAYSWSQTGEDGFTQFVTAEALHPLECKHLLTLVETSEPSLYLQFDAAPDDPLEITGVCWEDDQFGDTTAKGRSLTIEDGQFRLLKGAHIYQVTAKWEQGSVYYSFYIRYTPKN